MQKIDYTFSPEKAAAALQRIRAGEAPAQFCFPGMTYPDDASVLEVWNQQNEEFAADFAAAKRIGADAMVNYCLSIADNDRFKPDARKLMIDTRMKLAAIWHPAKYGAKAEPLSGIQALVNVNYNDLDPSKRAVVDKYFGTDDEDS